MILDLDRVSSDAAERFESDEVVTFDDVAGERKRVDCRVVVNVRHIGDKYYIDADASGRFETACHTCLEPTVVDLSAPFSLVVHRATSAAFDPEPAEDDDFIQVPMGQREFSLDQYIYENIIVNIPIRIACREACKGLCPQCGKNLNNETCTCSDAPDPRWDALRRLRDTDSE